MTEGIDSFVLPPLDAIEKATFYKRDEITTDLICCEVLASSQAWFFHEDVAGWVFF